MPKIRKRIEDETNKISNLFENEVIENTKNEKYILELPSQGIPRDELLKTVNRYLDLGKLHISFIVHMIIFFFHLGKYKWKEGFISGAIYYYDEELIKLLTEVFGIASYTNPLHSDIFPGICKMEAEVVRFVVNLFHGGRTACGTVWIY